VRRSAAAVEHHAREAQLRARAHEARDERSCRSGKPAGVDDEHDRPAGARGKVGGRTGPARVDAVEQAHHAFAQHEVRLVRERAEQAVERGRTHRPGIEIAAGTPRRGRVEGRIDIVGPGLGRCDAQSAPGKGA
jgi:hypothetical protein